MSALDMETGLTRPLAAMFRRSPAACHLPARPSFSSPARRPARRGTCRLTVMSLGTARPANGSIGPANEARCCGLFPGSRPAAKAAPAAAQFYGHQVVIRLRQGRGPAKNAPTRRLAPPRPLDWGGRLAKFQATACRHIRQHDHRQLLVEKLGDRLPAARPRSPKPDVGKRRQRPGEIECRCQQRLARYHWSIR